MRFEPLTTDDLEKIRFLQPEDWPDITVDFAEYLKQDFCFPLKVVSGSSIIGTGAAIVFGSSGWLAHIIVDMNHRNKGIGREITLELIRILKKHGKETILLLATELGYPVYVKIGFRVVSEYTYLKRVSDWKAGGNSDNITPYSPQHNGAILDMDRAVTGENREELIAPKIGSSLLFIRNRNLLGYFIPGIGEGPIVAKSEEAGLALMKVKYRETDKAVLPAENSSALEFLMSNGFDYSGKRGIRMISGRDIDWHPENIFSRIGGNYG